MDPGTIFQRATVTRRPGDLLPGDTQSEKWVATDPETGCQGVGRFEEAARTNLVYAVEAFDEADDQSVPFMSSGTPETYRMSWRKMPEETIGDTLRNLLPF